MLGVKCYQTVDVLVQDGGAYATTIKRFFNCLHCPIIIDARVRDWKEVRWLTP